MSESLIAIKNGSGTYVSLPNPTKYIVPASDLDSTETTRTEEGYLVRNRVRQGVTKVELGWTTTSSVIASIAPLVEPASIDVRFYNPHTASFVEKTLYVGDRSCVLSLYTNDMSLNNMLWEYSFNLIEY